MAHTYKYPRPALTVDAAIFRNTGSSYEILLIQRGNPPFKGDWALPGGFIDMDESLEEAINRELMEETDLSNIDLKQLHAFSKPGRDPRGHTITVAFWGILENNQAAIAGDDAHTVRWYNINYLPKLAFDHDDIIEIAVQKLTNKH